MMAMGFTEACRQESIKRLPSGVSNGAAEHLLRRAVKQQDSLVLIHRDDRIHR